MAQGSQGNALAVAVVLAIVCAIAVALRFHVRRERRTGFGVDDWLCLPALTFTVTCCGLIAAGSVHSHNVKESIDSPGVETDPEVVALQRLSFAFIVLQPLALGFTKASILFFYRRVFCGKTFDVMSWTLVALVGVWSVALFLASLLQCSVHLPDFWTKTQTTARCHALSTSGAFITTDIVLDLAIMIFPIPWIVNLQMPLKKRLLVCLVFLVGGLAIAAGLARLAFFGNITRQSPVLLSQVWGVIMLDSKGFDSIALFCPTIELGVALVAACLPSLQMTIARAGTDISSSPEHAWRHMVKQSTRGESITALNSLRTPRARPPQSHPSQARPSQSQGRVFIDTVGQQRVGTKSEENVQMSWKDML